jgi:hypothetical protein
MLHCVTLLGGFWGGGCAVFKGRRRFAAASRTRRPGPMPLVADSEACVRRFDARWEVIAMSKKSMFTQSNRA